MSSSTITPSGASTAVASSRSLVSAARECSPSMWTKRGRRPPSLASSSAGAMVRLSAFQVMRRSGAIPCLAQLASKRSMTSGLGQSKRSMPSAVSPGASACARAMKKRPSKGPISTTGPADPHLGLHAHEPAADGGGKARGHAGHARVAGLEVAVDGGDARPDRGAGHGGGGRLGTCAFCTRLRRAADHGRAVGHSQGGSSCAPRG